MKRILITMFFLGAISLVKSQDYHFSQYFDTPLLINPAFTGDFSGNQRAILVYRNQWAGIIQSPYKTFGFSFDSKAIGNDNETGYLSFGLSLVKDKAGSFDLSTTQVLASVAFDQKVSENNRLSAALQGGVSQRTINFTEEVWNAIYNTSNNTGSSFPSGTSMLHLEYTHLDLAGGLVYNYASNGDFSPDNEGLKITLGAAFHHFNRPNKTYTEVFDHKLYTRYVFHGNGSIGISETGFAVQPSFIMQFQGPNREILAGMKFRYLMKETAPRSGLISESAMSAGVYLRYLDSVIPYVGLEFSNYSIGITYDVHMGELGKTSIGKTRGLEINLRYIFPPPMKIK